MTDVTQILNAIEQGDPSAAEQLLPLVYDELRKLAASEDGSGEARARRFRRRVWSMRRICGWWMTEKAQHWTRSGAFLCGGCRAMRRILVDSARAEKSRPNTVATAESEPTRGRRGLTARPC